MTHQARQHRQAEPADTPVFVGLLILLLWIPLPLGSNRELFSAALACGATLLLAVRLSLGLLRGLPVPGMSRLFIVSMIGWLGWLIWIWLPLLPVTPACATESGLAQQTGWPCTIDRAATWEAALLSSAYFCLFIVSALVVQGHRRSKLLMLTLATSGSLQALYAILDAFASGSEPGQVASIASGSFVNRNHLAGYLILCIPAALASILSDTRGGRLKDRWDWLRASLDVLLSRRLVVRAGLLVMMIALVMTQSRLGNIAALAALGSAGLLFTWFHYRRRLMPILLLFASIIVVDLIIVERWYGLDRVIERVEQTQINEDTRALIWRDSEALVSKFGRLGSGLGTFERAFEPVRSDDIQRRIDHAHNAYLEFIVETGAIGLVLLSIILLPQLWQMNQMNRSGRYGTATFGLFGLAAALGTLIHAAGEFSLHIPAIAASFITILGVCAGQNPVSGNYRRVPLD